MFDGEKDTIRDGRFLLPGTEVQNGHLRTE